MLSNDGSRIRGRINPGVAPLRRHFNSCASRRRTLAEEFGEIGREIDLLRCSVGDARALQIVLEALDRVQQRPPMLKDLRLLHGLTLQQLADAAQVPTRTVLVAEIGGPVTQGDAKSLLEALNRLAEQEYTLEQVWFSIKPDSPPTTKQQIQPFL